MDDNQESEAVSLVMRRGDDELQDVFRLCADTLRDLRLARTAAGRVEQLRRIDRLGSALANLRIRLELADLLGDVPGVSTGPGKGPADSAALEALRRALNVIARRDT